MGTYLNKKKHRLKKSIIKSMAEIGAKMGIYWWQKWSIDGQACQEKTKKIIFLQWLINIACNKYIKDSYQRAYMLNRLKGMKVWEKAHNMTNTQLLEIS